MKIAVITGASSGLGREYSLETAKSRDSIDEIWLIARREDRLKETAKDIKKPVRILPLDITDGGAQSRYKELLNEQKPEVALLINNAGFGRLGDFDKIGAETGGGMVRLNCEALTVMTALTLPFMTAGSEIINACSIAAFAPNTGMAVYSSTKAYVLSLSKALRSEL